MSASTIVEHDDEAIRKPINPCDAGGGRIFHADIVALMGAIVCPADEIPYLGRISPVDRWLAQAGGGAPFGEPRESVINIGLVGREMTVRRDTYKATRYS